jgi:hypothetical protein
VELADHPVDEHVEVELAHPGDERLGRLRVGLDPEGRVLLRQALQGDGQLVLVGLGLGLDLDLDDRLREGHRLEDDRMLRIGQRVAGEGVLEADGRGDVAGVDLSISSRWLACIWRMRPIRSRLPLVGFSTYEPALSVPE